MLLWWRVTCASWYKDTWWHIFMSSFINNQTTRLFTTTAMLIFENKSITSCLSTPNWLQTSETDTSSSSYCQTDFLSYTKDDKQVTGPRPINTKQQLTQLSPYNHESTVELAGSCFARDRPHFGSRAFWRENMEHLVEADRGWRYTMGEQVPESFIMSQLLGLLLPSAKTTSAGWCSWQIGCRLFEARPFSVVFCRGNVCRSCWWLCVFFQCELTRVHERAALTRKKYQHVAEHRHSDEGKLFLCL